MYPLKHINTSFSSHIFTRIEMVYTLLFTSLSNILETTMVITSAALYDKELSKLHTLFKQIDASSPNDIHQFSLPIKQEKQYSEPNIVTHSTQYEELQNIASSNILILLQDEPQYSSVIKEMIANNLLHDYEKEYLLSGDSKFLYIPEETPAEEAPSNLHRNGKISALFESGIKGSQTIGYDPVGGTSYGTYQLSSTMGTVDRFIEFLNKSAPDIAQEFSKHSITNTGNKHGAFPETWKTIAVREKELFQKLEYDFVNKYYYEPILQEVKDRIPLTTAIKETLFSTAIQHGVSGASSIVNQALNTTGNIFSNEHDFIRKVYTIRQNNFSSSPLHIQEAVKSRLENEVTHIISYISQL
ncbi:MAG: hypothetical protein ACRCV3_00175 [Desulfovibrionaceae bacterium]